MMNITYFSLQSGPYRQRGAMSLLISLVILVLITFVSLYTAKTITLEQKISGNTVQSRQAFEAAEAGMEAAISYASNTIDRDGDGDASDELIFRVASGIDVLADADDDDASTTNDVGTKNTMVFDDGSQVEVVFSGNTDEFGVQSTGTSADGSATRTVFQTLSFLKPFPSNPGMPMISRGSIGLGGSGTIFNFEGETSVWTGDNSGASQGAMKTAVASIFDDTNYPECLGGAVKCSMQSRTAGTTSGGDINEYDDNLKNMSEPEFFKNFFGFDKETYKAVHQVAEMTPAQFANLTSGTLPDEKIIVVTGDVAGNQIPNLEFGCSTGTNAERSTGGWNNVPSYDSNADANKPCADANLEPYTIIVEGDLDAKGISLLGILYAEGQISLSGNAYIEGLVMTAGGTGTITGSLDLWYNTDILNAANEDSTPSSTSGTWHDF